MTVELGDI